MPRTQAPALDDLAELLEDWRRHLRATNHAPSTVASYMRVAQAFRDYLSIAGMPTTASGVNREHVEAYLVP